jgi:CRISPR-associated endonuclease/helicase Cas3
MPRHYAHSRAKLPVESWELLEDHLGAVAATAAAFAKPFGWETIGVIAGRLHDLGKYSAQFQAYIAGTDPNRRGGDHSSAGALAARDRYQGAIGKMLAYVIAGHHAGLADGTALTDRLKAFTPEPGIITHDIVATLPDRPVIAKMQPSPDGWCGFAQAMRVRMLFSCLVDADFLETERFYVEARRPPLGQLDIAGLAARLAEVMAGKLASAPHSTLNTLRREVLEHAMAQAERPTGLFSLTVPTGGGKTLASLSFALEHARHHGLLRVIYVIPFTSIIEQTAAVFREALGKGAGVLEHHASIDWDDLPKDDEGTDGAAKLRRATENWDAKVVVTTAVQFFESLFANRTQRCRKLHNIARSVIVLDEAQSLPLGLLKPCMAAMDDLARNYGASVVLCTATQPALRRQQGFVGGLDIPEDRELAPDPARLYTALRRVRMERLAAPVSDADIAARFADQPQMLCIVNTRAHALALFQAIRHLPGAVHLSTLMCPRHRRQELARLRADLLLGDAAVRLVSTSLIEAGVDISFPEVWRAETGLDAINQAAGRCNREGRPELGRVVVFKPDAVKRPRALTALIEGMEFAARRHADPLSLEAIEAYFQHVYWQEKDKTGLDQHGILESIAERANSLDFPFESIAQKFRMIEEVMVSVVVPWQADAQDDDAKQLLARIVAMDQPLSGDLRHLQQYMVPIPKPARDVWLAMGALRPVHERLGDALLRFENDHHYDPLMGLRIRPVAEVGLHRHESGLKSGDSQVTG